MDENLKKMLGIGLVALLIGIIAFIIGIVASLFWLSALSGVELIAAIAMIIVADNIKYEYEQQQQRES